MNQIEFGTPGKDKIVQYGGTGNSTQYAEGAASDDWILQVGGDLTSDQTAMCGDGNDIVHQYGGGKAITHSLSVVSVMGTRQLFR